MNVKELKAYWLERLKEHTGIEQKGFAKRLNKIKTKDELIKLAEQDIKYWNGEGDTWEHGFYYQFAGIAEDVKEKTKDSNG